MSEKSKRPQSQVAAAKEKLSTNLKSSVKRRADLPLIMDELSNMIRMTLNKDIIGRFLALYDKDKKTPQEERIDQVTSEVIELWQNMNFPVFSKSVVRKKVKTQIDLYEKYRRRPADSRLKKKIESLFNITQVNGTWLSAEDKKFYLAQIESGGKIGYATHKVAPKSSIHPSKRARLEIRPAEDDPSLCELSDSDNVSDSNDKDTSYENPSVESPQKQKKKKKRNSTASAARLVAKHSLSTNKASLVSHSLAEDGARL